MFLRGSKISRKKTSSPTSPSLDKTRGSPLRDLGTVESRYNEPLYNEVISVTNDFLYNLKLIG